MLDTIYLLLFRIFGFLIKVLPNFVLSSFAKLLSKAAYRLDKKHVKIANANLDFAFDNTLDRQRKKEIILLAYENLVKNLVGIVKNLEIQKAALLAKTEYEGLEIIQKLQSANKNIIFVTAHYGNWEAMGKCVAAKTGLKLVAVGRELDVKSLNDALKRSRERFDSELISKHGAMRKLVKALKEQSNNAVGATNEGLSAINQGIEKIKSTERIFKVIFENADALKSKISNAAELTVAKAKESESAKEAIGLAGNVAKTLGLHVQTLQSISKSFKL